MIAIDVPRARRARHLVRKAKSRSQLVADYCEQQMMRVRGYRELCPSCRRVNAHASGCPRPDPISMPATAKIPRAGAGRREWKKIAGAYPHLRALRLLADYP
jgi:hypothetical protein